MKLENFVYKKLGQFDGFYTHPPLEGKKIYVSSGQLASMNNDAHEVWLGTANNWDCYFSQKDFRKIVLWYLWLWLFKDLCGLRTFVWFKLLKRKCARYAP